MRATSAGIKTRRKLGDFFGGRTGVPRLMRMIKQRADSNGQSTIQCYRRVPELFIMTRLGFPQ